MPNSLTKVLYIKATKGNLKICPLIAVAFIYRIKLYALFKNGKTETVLYKQCRFDCAQIVEI
jgi:hypothetical protein